MKRSFLIIGLGLITAVAYAQQKQIPVEPGVSRQLAEYRRSVIGDIHYHLAIDIPREKDKPVTGISGIRFDLRYVTENLQIDFKQPADHIRKIEVLGHDGNLPVIAENEHIIIDKKYLHTGENFISIKFIAGDASLNRNTDYLYALFVPDHARTVFPCFDQPDLKAKFLLALTVPNDWHVLANGLMQTIPAPKTTGEHTEYFFNETDKLPTYLFSFTAGKYTTIHKTIAGHDAEFLYRETDTAKIRFSTDAIFKSHENAIDFLQEWTGIPFPFQKVGFVAIPDFQFGGMEHPGEVQYKASSLFLDAGATKDQVIARTNLISHETAHMWFGDLVTMRWFNDVWMKEVFANFMADKITGAEMGKEVFDLKFLQDHYPAAYGVDRTEGSHPIRQSLDNLQDAGSLYGNIIYHKAPIMMRQLEMMMGEENFQKGVRDYLKKYAYSNATWPDLIAELCKYTHKDIRAWNRVWVDQPGRPVFGQTITYRNGKIAAMTITQHPERGAARVWPQAFSITLVYGDHEKIIPVSIQGQSVNVSAAIGLAKPNYILFNSNGIGYGVFPMDKSITREWYDWKSPVRRASAYINAYEHMLSAKTFRPGELIRLFTGGIGREENEMNLRLITGYISTIYWTFLTPAQRDAYHNELEQSLWAAMQKQQQGNNKKILFKTYQDVYIGKEAGERIYSIWKAQHAPDGVKLNEDDYTSMALSIALKNDTATHVLLQQTARITNADRKARLAWLSSALSPDVNIRDAFFASLSERKNREKEAWVVTAVGYLHHPLRQSTSIKYLPKSLDLLQEIKQTGDIFFPQSWLGATFGNYQSPQAWAVVNDFLKGHPGYDTKLRDKLLQATDNLRRAKIILALKTVDEKN
ncbi:aminopeptidase [Mucilaginibacter mali]|uniref:Aminopeptidase N n=1 Tax=Mucilaginibacter mali TaxID=2740462 RepID=A0A7D4QIN7_9SPHI|nr:M1 family aminopeptidase [Mucilaginibacter mali]QKJ29190.1 aminopeptidase [Mucilaginibacter mali]